MLCFHIGSTRSSRRSVAIVPIPDHPSFEGDGAPPEPPGPKKRRVGSREFVVLDVDENYEPPERPRLRVDLIGNLIGFHIETVEYDAKLKVTVVREIASIVVDVEPLWNGL